MVFVIFYRLALSDPNPCETFTVSECIGRDKYHIEGEDLDGIPADVCQKMCQSLADCQFWRYSPNEIDPNVLSKCENYNENYRLTCAKVGGDKVCKDIC